MINLSQLKRQRMLEFLNKIKEEHTDDESLIAINEIETELTDKKYGLVWEEHEERVDIEMQTKIPVFTEVAEKEITGNENLPYNFILEGDNLHSLKLLEKTHKEKIDVIYIDPPYNTKNKDFVYDDTYIDELDGFKHSKWLSFMSERLLIARNILTQNGVIVISIGYQEVHNLMVMCQELFDNRQVTCVTVQTSGGKPNGGFNFSHEYLVFISPHDFVPNPSEDAMNEYSSPYHGMNLANFNQTQRPNQAYPIYVDSNGCIVGCGKSLQERVKEGIYTGDLSGFTFDYDESPTGTVAIWPVTTKGDSCVWRLISSRLLSDWKKGYIKIAPKNSKKNKNLYTIQYLSAGVIGKIKSGEFDVYRINDREDTPTIDIEKYKTAGADIQTVWTDKQFYTTKGSNQIKEIFGCKAFPYPKPLELISGILRRIVHDNSIVLDFFAGSGTTGQAVLELNQYDGANRSFILCTNNENNICESVTYPRIKTIITGKRLDGSVYSEGIPANIKCYKTDFINKISDNLEYSIGNELLNHIAEMVQLEYAVKLDGTNYILLMSDDEADILISNTDKLDKAKGVYISTAVLLTSEQDKALSARGINIFIIPDYYFESELLEVGER